jgi:hypothetical protein
MIDIDSSRVFAEMHNVFRDTVSSLVTGRPKSFKEALEFVGLDPFDCSEQRWTGLSFNDEDLNDVDFSYANVESSSFAGADMKGTNFFRAKIGAASGLPSGALGTRNFTLRTKMGSNPVMSKDYQTFLIWDADSIDLYSIQSRTSRRITHRSGKWRSVIALENERDRFAALSDTGEIVVFSGDGVVLREFDTTVRAVDRIHQSKHGSWIWVFGFNVAIRIDDGFESMIKLKTGLSGVRFVAEDTDATILLATSSYGDSILVGNNQMMTGQKWAKATQAIGIDRCGSSSHFAVGQANGRIELIHMSLNTAQAITGPWTDIKDLVYFEQTDSLFVLENSGCIHHTKTNSVSTSSDDDRLQGIDEIFATGIADGIVARRGQELIFIEMRRGSYFISPVGDEVLDFEMSNDHKTLFVLHNDGRLVSLSLSSLKVNPIIQDSGFRRVFVAPNNRELLLQKMENQLVIVDARNQAAVW